MATKQKPKKLIIGWFSYSCCEDSTIMMTEILNDHYTEWLKYLDFKYAKVLRKHTKAGPMDIAFVEGAIASKKQEDELKEVRKNAKKLIAIGSCACTGMPSGHRNVFDSQTKKEIKAIMEKFHYGEKVKKVEDVVAVDAKVPGCPMNSKKFVDLVESVIAEFKTT